MPQQDSTELFLGIKVRNDGPRRRNVKSWRRRGDNVVTFLKRGAPKYPNIIFLTECPREVMKRGKKTAKCTNKITHPSSVHHIRSC